jgi:predicted Zn finger-like uncharacterized protein
MNTHCPKCETRYRIDDDALMGTSGMGHCYRCGTLFDIMTGKAAEPDADEILLNQSAIRLDHRAEHARIKAEPAPQPFDLPDDVEPLQPSPDATLDVADTLFERRSRRGVVYGLVAVVLLTGLGLQLAWQYREDLLSRFPQLEAVCEHIACRPDTVRAPDRFSILQRDIQPTANQINSLTLRADFRNDAELAQPLPDIQLSLLDNNGGVLIRRRLTPGDYLFPAPAEDKVVSPGEVITISVDFEDPGHLATGFSIDFL